jgi:GNAT superfamily N-acetyltransferase
MPDIQIAQTDEEILACFPVVSQLRPHLKQADFVSRVRRQQEGGYLLAFLQSAGEVKAVAGYRYTESLAWGKYLYVDDLVTIEVGRSRGYGGQLLNWLVAQARAQQCVEFHLDSGVQRFGAHRFYLTNRMDIIAHHFAMKLR